MRLEDQIAEALKKAIRILPDDVERLIRRAYETESGKGGRLALDAVIRNIEASGKSGLPLCQDTGLIWCIAEIGRDNHTDIAALESLILSGAEKGAEEGYFRKSSVEDPIYTRRNTLTNMPPIINYVLKDGCDITLRFLMKGFGSENCSSVRMLNPTAGEDGVVAAVVDMMKKAGGKPCPPVSLGIGVGSTMDGAALLSKRAFFKEGEESRLERRIKDEVNKLGIGPGGLGGDNTCLSVQLLEAPTHIAGLPVALTVNCWADRKASLVIKGGYCGKNS